VDKPLKSDAWPVRRQIYRYLPSRRASPPLDQYQLTLLCNKIHVCEQLGCYLTAEWPRLQPFVSRVQHRSYYVTPPRYLYSLSLIPTTTLVQIVPPPYADGNKPTAMSKRGQIFNDASDFLVVSAADSGR